MCGGLARRHMISRRVARMPAVRSFLVVVGTGMCYVGVLMVFLWPTPSIKVKHDSFFLCVVVAMTRDVEWGEGGEVGGGGLDGKLGTFHVSAHMLFMVEIRYQVCTQVCTCACRWGRTFCFMTRRP